MTNAISNMDKNHIRSWSATFVSDDFPELATNKEWREAMATARKAAKITQAELATKCDTKQPQISDIESGAVSSSKLILPICRELGIDPPFHHASDEMRIWSALGIELHTMSKRRYQIAVTLIKDILEELKARNDAEEDRPLSNRKPPSGAKPRR